MYLFVVHVRYLLLLCPCASVCLSVYRFCVQAVADESMIRRVRNPFRHAFVFMIGGGNYAEFQNIKEYERKCNEKVRLFFSSFFHC